MALPRVLILADDLTGALDSAAPFAQRGLVTRMHAIADTLTGDDDDQVEVLSINTESRHLPAQQAQRVVAQVLARLDLRSRFVYKKIDSTLRGNVVAESLAVLDASERQSLIVAPAFPAQGRTVRAGIVYVRHTPLAQTEFVRDAVSPAPATPLGDLFQAAAPAAQLITGKQLMTQTGGATAQQRIEIIDSDNDAQLDALAAQLLPNCNQIVAAGSAGLTSALARCFPPRGRRSAAPSAEAVMFMIGSRASSSAEQVERLRALDNVAFVAAPNGVPSDAAWAQLPAGAHVLMQAVPGTASVTAQHAASNLARAVRSCLAQRAMSTVIATGGDTAAALLHELQRPVLDVLGELLPGIAESRIEIDARSVRLITKAGGFGDADALVRILQTLTAAKP